MLTISPAVRIYLATGAIFGPKMMLINEFARSGSKDTGNGPVAAALEARGG